MKGVRTIKIADYTTGDRVLLRGRIYNVTDVFSTLHTLTLQTVVALRLDGWIHSPYVLAQNCRKVVKINNRANIKNKILHTQKVY